MTEPKVNIVNLKSVSDFIKKVPDYSFDALKEELAISLLEADKNIKANAELERRSGNLMKSMTSEIEGTSIASLKASEYTDCIYAGIHETGGTVTAKNAYRGVPGGPYLNIPGKANLTAAGVMRQTPKMVFDNGGFIMGKTVMRGGNDEARKYDVMFYLKKSITVPPRLNMVKSVEDGVPTLLARFSSRFGDLK